ncbi:MAG: hypothetical protein GAK45_01348 [Pseudomonas citronellolis]|nr:MAG: hypothetical protein GAK45_01348 [Pseudomonas citronellolis]
MLPLAVTCRLSARSSLPLSRTTAAAVLLSPAASITACSVVSLLLSCNRKAAVESLVLKWVPVTLALAPLLMFRPACDSPPLALTVPPISFRVPACWRMASEPSPVALKVLLVAVTWLSLPIFSAWLCLPVARWAPPVMSSVLLATPLTSSVETLSPWVVRVVSVRVAWLGWTLLPITASAAASSGVAEPVPASPSVIVLLLRASVSPLNLIPPPLGAFSVRSLIVAVPVASMAGAVLLAVTVSCMPSMFRLSPVAMAFPAVCISVFFRSRFPPWMAACPSLLCWVETSLPPFMLIWAAVPLVCTI